ncbi:chemotaxis protein CheC [Haloglomus salinum]|jgi:chemotaxis protein CheC|uniref:chemotaxis protein CheC n=1 Tax=Haloglomus salinum TaxID=2962673 RepID=UPI0020C96F3D|nr:chemotaxis protein CheC [Haloglomus salinum]
MSDRDPEAKRAGGDHSRGRVQPPSEGARESWTIPIEKLAVMNRLGEVGADGVEERVDKLGIDEVVSEQVKSGYVTPDDAHTQFGDEDRVGVRVRLPGAPGGYVLVLFDPASANRAAAVMLEDSDEAVETAGEEMAWSTIQELGSIMSSGFVDSWANMFDERIDIATPDTVSNTEAEILRATVAAGDDLGIYIASQLHIPAYDIDASVYVLPDNRTFLKILGQLEVGSIQR